MMYNETRIITAEAIRNLCINKNWYTRGTNAEYAYLLKYERIPNICTKDIINMATDIKAHSDTEYEITSIAFEIARICLSRFEEIEINSSQRV